jgi:hypothetical protein
MTAAQLLEDHLSAIHPLLRSQWRLDRFGDQKADRVRQAAPSALTAEGTVY